MANAPPAKGMSAPLVICLVLLCCSVLSASMYSSAILVLARGFGGAPDSNVTDEKDRAQKACVESRPDCKACVDNPARQDCLQKECVECKYGGTG